MNDEYTNAEISKSTIRQRLYALQLFTFKLDLFISIQKLTSLVTAV